MKVAEEEAVFRRLLDEGAPMAAMLELLQAEGVSRVSAGLLISLHETGHGDVIDGPAPGGQKMRDYWGNDPSERDLLGRFRRGAGSDGGAGDPADVAEPLDTAPEVTTPAPTDAPAEEPTSTEKLTAAAASLRRGQTMQLPGGSSIRHRLLTDDYMVAAPHRHGGDALEVRKTPEDAAKWAERVDSLPGPRARRPVHPTTREELRTGIPAAVQEILSPVSDAIAYIESLDGLFSDDDQTPVKVGSDVNRAADLLAEGKDVELDSPKQASTLIQELANRIRTITDAGGVAPNINLCQVTVKNTNLFCSESKGIERVKMPQLKGVPQPGSPADKKFPKDSRGEVDLSHEFRLYLAAQGARIKDDKVPADHLKATQNELNGAKTVSMTQFLDGGGKFDPALDYLVSRDNYIIDGHHRWASTMAHDAKDGHLGDEEMDVAQVDMDIIDMLKAALDFSAQMGIPNAGMGQGFGTEKG